MEFAWAKYREKAWGYDEITPRSGNGNNHWSGTRRFPCRTIDRC
jgi:hypothetical protein